VYWAILQDKILWQQVPYEIEETILIVGYVAKQILNDISEHKIYDAHLLRIRPNFKDLYNRFWIPERRKYLNLQGRELNQKFIELNQVF
jgi:hypothetical protein